MLKSLLNVFSIFLALTLYVWLLNASTRRRIIMRDCQTNHATIWKINGTLNESFTERSPTYNRTSILVLKSTRNDFGSRSRILVYQSVNLTIQQATISLRPKFLTRSAPSFRIDNQIVSLQKLISYHDGSLHQSTAILLQVDDEVFHSCFLQGIHTRHKLIVSSGTKATDTDITNCWANHIYGIYGLHGNLIARNDKLQLTRNATTDNPQIHFRAFLSTQSAHDFLFRHLHASNGSIVYGYDAVASDDSNLF